MRKLTIVLIVCLLALPAFADQKYNPFSNKWETTTSDSSVQYNPHQNNWSYQPPESDIEYNPHNNAFEWTSGNQGEQGDD